MVKISQWHALLMRPGESLYNEPTLGLYQRPFHEFVNFIHYLPLPLSNGDITIGVIPPMWAMKYEEHYAIKSEIKKCVFHNHIT